MQEYILGLLGAAVLGYMLGMFLSSLVELGRMIWRDVKKWRGSR